MEAAVTKVPHSSALEYCAISIIQVKARGKSALGFSTVVRWDNIKHNSQSNLKFSLLEMLLHKSRKYRAILDISFVLKVAGWDLSSVKKGTKETSPTEVLEQVGTVMPRIIEALATALLSEEPINFSKLDIEDGFWRMVCAVGEKWYFSYVLLIHLEAPTELVILYALQIGCTLSPRFSHVTSETARDLAE